MNACVCFDIQSEQIENDKQTNKQMKSDTIGMGQTNRCYTQRLLSNKCYGNEELSKKVGIFKLLV